MKRVYMWLLALVVIFQTVPLFAHEGERHDESTEQSTSTEVAQAKKYVCPMHPDVQSDKPGQCPKCGMTLKQMTQEDASGEGSHEGHDHEHQ